VALALALLNRGPLRPAKADGERVHMRYTAPTSCPSESDFIDMIARDGAHFVRAADGELARGIDVLVESANAVNGRVTIREIDGREAVRPITGDSCEAVVRALAVIVMPHPRRAVLSERRRSPGPRANGLPSNGPPSNGPPPSPRATRRGLGMVGG